MTTDPREIALALSLLDAARQSLTAFEQSPTVSPDGRERTRQIIGRLQVEADILAGGDERGLVRQGLTQEQRAQFYREMWPKQTGAGR